MKLHMKELKTLLGYKGFTEFDIKQIFEEIEKCHRDDLARSTI